MNRRIFIISAFCFLFFALSADTWLQTYDPFDEAVFNVEDVIVCSDGGYAINGTCIDQQTTIGWGFVIKTDSNGNMLWAKRDTVSFQIENESQAIVETEDEGILSASFLYNGGTAMIKRDSDGNREWTRLLEDFYVLSMDKINDNDIITAGYNTWPALAKINQNAEVIWSQTYSFEGYDFGVIESIYKSLDGGYLLSGMNYNSDSHYDILIIKTDAEGDTLWTRILDASNENDTAKTIIETDEGDVIVGGELENFSGFLWKLDSEGNTIWLETVMVPHFLGHA